MSNKTTTIPQLSNSGVWHARKEAVLEDHRRKGHRTFQLCMLSSQLLLLLLLLLRFHLSSLLFPSILSLSNKKKKKIQTKFLKDIFNH